MPRYTNPTAEDIIISEAPNIRLVIRPGEFADSLVYLTAAEATAYGLTRVEAPFYPLALSNETVTFIAAGANLTTVSLIDSRVVVVHTTVDVTLRANVAANTFPYFLPANNFLELKNNRNIEAIHITAIGAGVITVMGLRD